MPDETLDEQMKAEAKHKLGTFGMLNAMFQHFTLGNRTISGGGTVPNGDDIPVHPLGNTFQIDGSTKQEASPSKIPQLALATLALAGGGVGIANLSGLLPEKGAPAPIVKTESPAPAKKEPVEIPLQIEWEFEPDGGNGGKPGQ